MAHGLLDEDILTPDGSNTESIDAQLLPYLHKHKLPIQNFINKEIILTDLMDFDFSFFEGMCRDLSLNTAVRQSRFKKLIKELNNHNHKSITKQNQIKQQVKFAENKINQTFDSVINDLNKRKTELLHKLHHISKIKLNDKTDTKTNIQFTYNPAKLKNEIHNFGIVYDAVAYLQPPNIVTTIKNNDLMIILKDCKDNKIKDTEYIIEYKQFDLCDNDDEKKDEQLWKVVKSSSSIKNIAPFNKYYIRAKYSMDSNIWSKYSKVIPFESQLDCFWNKSQHKRMKNVQIIDKNKKLCCNSKCGTVCVVSMPVFNGNILKRVKFEFVIDEFCQTSMFGLVSMPIEKTMKEYWNNNTIATNKYSLILECMDGLKSIHRYQYGKDMDDNTFWSSSGITLSESIEKGDHFIFDIDFDECSCNVYVNDCGKTEVATWTNIDKKMVAVYGHSASSKLMKKRSIVQIKLLSYEVR